MPIRLYASIFLLNDNEQLLLVREGKEKNYGLWNLPGGHVEDAEEVLPAAIREAKEETGLAVEPTHLLQVFGGRNRDSLHFVFLARSYNGELTVTGPEILEAKWVLLKEVESMSNALLHPFKFERLIAAYAGGQYPPADIVHYARPS